MLTGNLTDRQGTNGTSKEHNKASAYAGFVVLDVKASQALVV